MKVILKKDTTSYSLSEYRIYEVLGIEQDYYRILSERTRISQREPCLYEKDLFKVVDQSMPHFWITTTYDDATLMLTLKDGMSLDFLKIFTMEKSQVLLLFLNL